MWEKFINRFYLFRFFTLLAMGLPIFVQAVDFSAVPGTVIDYQKLNYFFSTGSRIYISDPEIVVLPSGDYIASDSLSGSSSSAGTSGQTELFRSTNQGATWTSLGTKNGILRGSLFVFGGDLYLLGANDDTDGMPTVIMKSTDNGTTWSSATQINLGGPATPNNPVVWGDRLWCATGTSDLSASINSNLLTAASWISSGGFPAYEPGWPSEGEFIGEGQIVASPEKGIFVLPKVKNHALTAVARVDPSSGAVSFDPSHDFVGLPGGEKKFGAAYDPVSSNFYVLSNPILPAHTNSSIAADMIRNTAAVLSSRDLFNWKVEKLFLYSTDVDTDGFGYMNFDFDDTNMVVVARTAFKVQDGVDPQRGHDSNLLTFHRLNDFRNLQPDQYLTISGNQILRYERTDYEPAPLGSFTLGSSFAGAALTSPNGMGQTAGGDVYIRESGGRILHFDATGNFIETNSTSPVSFQSSAMDISPLQGGECSWVRTGSGSWDDLLNWHYWGRPDTPEEVAVFGSAATAATTVSIPSKSREWLFNTDGDLEGWTTVNLTGTSVSGGVFSATPTSTDPQLFRTDQSFAGNDAPTITVRMRAATNNVQLQLYWATSASNSFHSSRLVTAAYTGNGAFQDVVFSLQGHAQWDGQIIRRLRIDPLNGPMIPFEIDSITVKKESSQLKGLRFRNSYPYTLSGLGKLQLGADSVSGSIEVLQGQHTCDIAMVLGSDTQTTVTNGSSLYLKAGIDLNNKTLHVTGSGKLLTQGAFVMNGGAVVLDGTTPLTLTNNATGTVLDGTLQFLPEEPFSPSVGDSFSLLENPAMLGSTRFSQVSLPVLDVELQWNTNALYSAGTVFVESIPMNSIPFEETFEGIPTGNSILVPENTNGWYSNTNTTIAVVTNYSYELSNLLHPVEEAAHTKVLQYSDANLTVRFETNAAPVNTTIDIMLSCSGQNSTVPDTSLVAGKQTAFYLDLDGCLNVWHGLDNTGTNNDWLTYTNTPLGTADWMRLTFLFDYTTDTENGNHYFKVLLNGIELVPPANGYSKGDGVFNADSEGVWLLVANPASAQVQSFTLLGSGMMDDFVVTTASVTNFFPPMYTLTGDATGKGTVSPASTNVPPGGNVNFVITADSYYRIVSLTTNGTDIGLSFDNNSTATNFTWSNVQSAGTLAAVFAEQIADDDASTPYWWLAQYGLTNFSADVATDIDGDGLLTWQEYVAGTDPTNAASSFRIQDADVGGLSTAIHWSSVSNRLYSVHYSTNLLEGFFPLPGASNLPATPPVNFYTNLSQDAAGFYRIDVNYSD